MAGLLIVPLAGASALWAYRAYTNRPVPQTSYYGVSLGMNKDEVTYVLGRPSNVIAPGNPFGKNWWDQVSLLIPTDKLPDGKKVGDYQSWSYDGPPRIDVGFDKDNGKVISVSCYASTRHCRSILDVWNGTSEKSVIEILGKPGTARIDDVKKIMDYPKLNVTLYLEKGEVYMLEVRQFRQP
ncbi:hypothetical protein [Burkholderia pseudomallei]|uniref:hypothetical protein n=1 Tax=Burkholderia pseudomallei TaxID=28450 RepID=UPI001178844C|nr:hypothetical protein [Burkholderia pseudomallei]